MQNSGSMIGRMPLLLQYLLRRWWRLALALALTFVTVLLLLFAAEVMGDIAGGEIPVSMLGWQLLLHLPELLITVLPLAMVMAVLLTRQQMQRDREWAMLTVAGMQPKNLRDGLARFMLTGFVLLLVLAGWLDPAAKAWQAQLYQRAANSAEFWGILPGRFNKLPDAGGVIYAAKMDRFGDAVDVFLRLQDDDGTQILSAERGRFRMQPDGDRYVTLVQGRRSYQDRAGELQLLDFAEAEIRLPVPQQIAADADARSWNWSRLWRSPDRGAQAEIQRRLAYPCMLPVLLVWLYALVRNDRMPVQPHHARGGGRDVLVLALLFVLYLNLLNLAAVWIDTGKLTVLPGFWWVHGMFLLSAVVWQRRGLPRQRKQRLPAGAA